MTLDVLSKMYYKIKLPEENSAEDKDEGGPAEE